MNPDETYDIRQSMLEGYINSILQGPGADEMGPDYIVTRAKKLVELTVAVKFEKKEK